MRRYYFSPITFDAARQENVIRAFEHFNLGGALAGAPHDGRSWVPPHDLGGRITGWCMVWIDTPDHAPLLADGDLVALPADLGSTFGSLSNQQRNAFNNRITQAGYVVAWNNQWTIRQILQHLCAQVEPLFSWPLWSGEG
jgi:hypothetical protein